MQALRLDLQAHMRPVPAAGADMSKGQANAALFETEGKVELPHDWRRIGQTPLGLHISPKVETLTEDLQWDFLGAYYTFHRRRKAFF
jgi:hypothetical protein